MSDRLYGWVGHGGPYSIGLRRLGATMMLLRLCFALCGALAGCAIPQAPPPPEALFETQGPPVAIAQTDDRGRVTGMRDMFAVVKNDAGWRRVLTPAQFAVLRQGVTQVPSPAADREPFADGFYRCAGCGIALFDSRDRFASGSGWPSFTGPIAPSNVVSRWDHSWGVRRRRIACARCGGALGHVFKDGPAPTYLRYCVNAAGLRFYDRGHIADTPYR